MVPQNQLAPLSKPMRFNNQLHHPVHFWMHLHAIRGTHKRGHPPCTVVAVCIHKKFGVHLVQHCFLPQGLDRCNGRGIENKLTLDPVKMKKTRKHNKNSHDMTVIKTLTVISVIRRCLIRDTLINI